MAPTLSLRSRRGDSRAAVSWPLLLLLVCFLFVVSSPAAAGEEGKVTCAFCQERGYPYLCQATMASGICFRNSGEMKCKENKCTCCRLVDAAGCTFCSMEAEWDEFDDSEEDL
ncbi:hypothetical protein LSCM1_00292 [Leishmania martiniquensis]|uniref:Uncharacterized protein n=1 Tax=Leishmania martiniquensis TaxID=1580590 RepID=A0A836FK94_9TRYP|nr:hypothetical protein LSCM1_00292 [Leishmania martiniquensis]